MCCWISLGKGFGSVSKEQVSWFAHDLQVPRVGKQLGQRRYVLWFAAMAIESVEGVLQKSQGPILSLEICAGQLERSGEAGRRNKVQVELEK